VSAPLRVLTVGNMYPPHHLGGAELIWHSSVRQMRKRRGWTVRVLTTDWRAPLPDASFPEEADVHRELPWYWRDHAFPRYGARERLAIERRAGTVLERHLRALDPDVVVWWSMGGMPLSLLGAPGRAGVPAAGVLLDDWLVYGPAVDGWQRLCRRLGPAGRALAAVAGIPAAAELGSAAEWIFMSETVRRHAADSGVDVSGSHVVHRGVNASRFRPGPERSWRGELLCLGRIDPRKGIEVALRALALEPLAGCRLRVVGDGDRGHLAELEELASRLGIAGRVVFEQVPGERVPALLAGADALLFPVQWEEPWGLVPLEAMAAGTPVVATGTGGSGEYLTDGVNSLVYAPRDDPAALAEAVARLAADQALRARLRAGGAETVARFSEHDFNERVAEIVAAVAEGPT
jgi:glycogen synthase